jgi:hypothetical protein
LNKILIFAGAQESKLLIEKISENYLNLAEFHIIYEDDEIKNSFEEKENLFFYKINFYAYELYKKILRKDFNKIIVLIKNKQEALFVLKKIKFYKTPILFVKFWMDFEIPENINNIEIIDVPEIITNKVIDFLPNVPLYARDIGLGIGEILEVEIPPHSPFSYKQVSIFERYGVKVAAIYRNNELKFPTSKTITLPNDKLILIGNPQTLKELFNQIKSSKGAFPQPYGQNIYLLLDMKNLEQKESSKLLKNALYLHRKLKHKKLIIKIINPNLSSLKIYKLYKFPNIDIQTEYSKTSYKEVLCEDAKKLNIGLIITNNKFFYKYKKTFLEIKKPILKSGEESIKKCEALGVILNDKYITKIAPVIFDLSFQLQKKVKFFDIDPENEHKEIKEYLRNLAKSFHFNKIEFITSNKKENPIQLLKKEKNLCLIEGIAKPPRPIPLQYLFPKIEESYTFLNKFNQFLIPIKDEDESNG